MLEAIVPIFMVHKVPLCEGETNEEFLHDLLHRADDSTLLTTFQRPTGVTRILDRLPKESCILVVACDEKTKQQLSFYERKEWDEKTEAGWREFLRDGTKVRYLQAKMGRIFNLELGDLAGAEEIKARLTESEKAVTATT